METLLSKISIMLVPALLAVTMHEVAHGYLAERFGDPTARLLGRLTLNPFKHLDPIGTLAVLIFGFGWARPVPVNGNNMRHPKRDMIWVSLAGPLTNFALAGVSALLLHLLATAATVDGAATGGVRVFEPLALMAGFSLYINVLLGVFNLLPIPPLDGGKVLTGVLPQRQSEWLARIEPFGFIFVVVLIFFTDFFQNFLAPIILAMVSVLAGDHGALVYTAIDFLLGR